MSIWVEIIRQHSNMDTIANAVLAVCAAHEYGDPQTIMAVEKKAYEKYPDLKFPKKPYDFNDLLKDMGIKDS